jgi:hypothetical protein
MNSTADMLPFLVLHSWQAPTRFEMWSVPLRARSPGFHTAPSARRMIGPDTYVGIFSKS